MITYSEKSEIRKCISGVFCNKCDISLQDKMHGYTGVQLICEGEAGSLAICGPKVHLHLCDKCFSEFSDSLKRKPQYLPEAEE